MAAAFSPIIMAGALVLPETNGARAYHVFAVTAWRGPGPTMLGDEHSEIAWFTIEAACALDLALAGYKPLLAGLGQS